jgi:uncharacterized protein (DUF983 family)
MKPEILVHPNIPKALHGIAPRVIMGKEWWDIERHKAYEKAGQKCEACGTARADAWPNRWLEAHEEYEYKPNGHLVFKGLVCLCPACHRFIHSGLLELHRRSGEISENLYQMIQAYGDHIIRTNDLLREYISRHDWCEDIAWQDYRIVFNGEEYGPSTQSYAEWEQGKWRDWKPETTKGE